MMFKNEQAVKDYSIATDTGSEEQMKIAVYCGSTAGNREAFTIGGSRAWRMSRCRADRGRLMRSRMSLRWRGVGSMESHVYFMIWMDFISR